MDLLTILSTLDAALNRETVSTKHDRNIVSWTKSTEFTTTYEVDEDETTITNCTRICLQNTSDGIKVHINHHNRLKITSTLLGDLDTITIGDT